MSIRRRSAGRARPCRRKLAEGLAPPGHVFARWKDPCSLRGGAIKLLEAKSWREVRRIGGVKGVVTSLRFAPDGKTLAGSDHRGVVLWDVATGREESGSTQPRRPKSGVLAFRTHPGRGHTGRRGTNYGTSRPGGGVGQASHRRTSRDDQFTIDSIAFSRTARASRQPAVTAFGSGLRPRTPSSFGSREESPRQDYERRNARRRPTTLIRVKPAFTAALPAVGGAG